MRSTTLFALTLALLLSSVVTPASAATCGWMMRAGDVADGGFESSATMSTAWCGEGPDVMGVDDNKAFQHSGVRNGFIEAHPAPGRAMPSWNAIKQHIMLIPGRNYELRGWVRTSGNVSHDGYFGVRAGWDGGVHAEVRFGASTTYQELVVHFNSGGLDKATVFTGYWRHADFSWLVVDDVTLQEV